MGIIICKKLYKLNMKYYCMQQTQVSLTGLVQILNMPRTSNTPNVPAAESGQRKRIWANCYTRSCKMKSNTCILLGICQNHQISSSYPRSRFRTFNFVRFTLNYVYFKFQFINIMFQWPVISKRLQVLDYRLTNVQHGSNSGLNFSRIGV